jgi:hypothetical protein
MTLTELRMQFLKETGKYSPMMSYSREITQHASYDEYIKYLEEYLIRCLEVIDNVEKIAKG